VFNVAAYLGKCLETITAQTLKNLDIVIVDDASTDSTHDLVATWKEKDARIRYLRLPIGTNGGAGQPTNRGIELCSPDSKYLALLDGDDFIAPTMYEKMVGKAEERQPPVDFVLANFAVIDESLVLAPNYDQDRWDCLVRKGSRKLLRPFTDPALFQISPVPWRKLYSMDFIRHHRLRFAEGDYFYEDNSFHWMVTLNAQRVSVVDEVLYFHRKGRKGQTTSAISKRRNADGINAGAAAGGADGIGAGAAAGGGDNDNAPAGANGPEGTGGTRTVDEEDDGGSSKQASVAGLFLNINYVGMYLFHYFSSGCRGTDIKFDECR
jgi:glycosyltransferase involved in cell wall biosynthesis